MHKDKRNIILSLLISLLFMGGTFSFAYFLMDITGTGSDVSKVTTGTLNLSVSDSSVNINNLAPIEDTDYKEYAYKKEFTINNNGTLNGCSSVYFDIKSISESLKNKYFKFKLVSGNRIYEGDFSSIVNNRLLLTEETMVEAGKNKDYTLYVWISHVKGLDQLNMLGTSVIGNISIESKDCRELSKKSGILTFNNNGGTGCDNKEITSGDKYGELCIPTKSGYNFVGWYKDSSFLIGVNSESIVGEEANHTLYAKWDGKDYTLTYDNNGGSGCSNKGIKHGEAYGTLCTPTKTGYNFTGWYTDLNSGTQVTSSTIATGNTTIYAHYIGKQFTLTYNNNGGSGCSTKEIRYKEAYGTLCTPTKPYYSFLGWYTSASGGEKITNDTVHNVMENVNVYAQYFGSFITVSAAKPSTFTCSNGTTTFTAENVTSHKFTVPSSGTWTIKGNYNGLEDSKTVNVTSNGESLNVELKYTTVFYDAGNQFTELTGGWQGYACGNGGGRTTINATDIKLNAGWGQATAVRTKNMVNLDGINTLYFTLTCNVSQHAHFGLTTSATANPKPGYDSSWLTLNQMSTGTKTYSIDVSSLNGSYYITIGINDHNPDSAEVTVAKVYGE